MLFSVQNEYNLVAIGDSQTAPRSTGASLESSYPSLVAKSRNYGNFSNVGLSGNTTSQMLSRFSNDVLAHRAGCISIMGFANDMTSNTTGGGSNPTWVGGGITVATTKANIKAMVQQAQSQKASVTILSAFPIRYPSYLANAAPYLAAMQEIANETSCAYVNVYAAVVSLGETERNSLYISGDLEHPNALGHKFIYETALSVNNSFRQY